MLFKKPIIHLRNDGKLIFDDTLQINAVKKNDDESKVSLKFNNQFEHASPSATVHNDFKEYDLKYYEHNGIGDNNNGEFIEIGDLPASKKYKLSFWSDESVVPEDGKNYHKLYMFTFSTNGDGNLVIQDNSVSHYDVTTNSSNLETSSVVQRDKFSELYTITGITIYMSGTVEITNPDHVIYHINGEQKIYLRNIRRTFADIRLYSYDDVSEVPDITYLRDHSPYSPVFAMYDTISPDGTKYGTGFDIDGTYSIFKVDPNEISDDKHIKKMVPIWSVKSDGLMSTIDDNFTVDANGRLTIQGGGNIFKNRNYWNDIDNILAITHDKLFQVCKKTTSPATGGEYNHPILQINTSDSVLSQNANKSPIGVGEMLYAPTDSGTDWNKSIRWGLDEVDNGGTIHKNIYQKISKISTIGSFPELAHLKLTIDEQNIPTIQFYKEPSTLEDLVTTAEIKFDGTYLQSRDKVVLDDCYLGTTDTDYSAFSTMYVKKGSGEIHIRSAGSTVYNNDANTVTLQNAGGQLEFNKGISVNISGYMRFFVDYNYNDFYSYFKLEKSSTTKYIMGYITQSESTLQFNSADTQIKSSDGKFTIVGNTTFNNDLIIYAGGGYDIADNFLRVWIQNHNQVGDYLYLEAPYIRMRNFVNLGKTKNDKSGITLFQVTNNGDIKIRKKNWSKSSADTDDRTNDNTNEYLFYEPEKEVTLHYDGEYLDFNKGISVSGNSIVRSDLEVLGDLKTNTLKLHAGSSVYTQQNEIISNAYGIFYKAVSDLPKKHVFSTDGYELLSLSLLNSQLYSIFGITLKSDTIQFENDSGTVTMTHDASGTHFRGTLKASAGVQGSIPFPSSLMAPEFMSTEQYLTFTGAHKSTLNDSNDYILGQLVRSDGASIIKVNDTKLKVSKTKKAKDKAVFGVVSKIHDDGDINVNSVGEGAIWICDTDGNVENGDYICSSAVPGFGMKQDSDFLMNYTVAKLTMDCTFEPRMIPKMKTELRQVDKDGNVEYEPVHDSIGLPSMVQDIDESGNVVMEPEYQVMYVNKNGLEITKEEYLADTVNNYRAALVACTYHCG